MKIRLFAILAAVLALVSLPARAQTRVCAIDVGKGDAILVLTDDYACLIDAGKAWAAGRIASALRDFGVTRLDAVFLTHTDSDHADGMRDLAKESGIAVDAWYASGFYLGKEKNHPLVKLGLDVTWLAAGDVLPAGAAGTITVLAPLSEDPDDEDENSLVLMLETPDGRVLLAGDMEAREEAALVASGADLSCDILKVANHGDGDTTGAAFAEAASARIAIISTDPYEKPGTPDPAVVARLEAAGGAVYTTQGARVIATLSGGSASAEEWVSESAYADLHAALSLSVRADDELMTIGNAGKADIPLSGWYLYSAKGDETFFFGESDALPAGGSVTVGTKSSPEGGFTIFWDDKDVISDKGGDTVTLYDPDGNSAAYGG